MFRSAHEDDPMGECRCLACIKNLRPVAFEEVSIEELKQMAYMPYRVQVALPIYHEPPNGAENVPNADFFQPVIRNNVPLFNYDYDQVKHEHSSSDSEEGRVSPQMVLEKDMEIGWGINRFAKHREAIRRKIIKYPAFPRPTELLQQLYGLQNDSKQELEKQNDIQCKSQIKPQENISVPDLENNFKNPEKLDSQESILPKVPSKDKVYFLPFNCNKQNPWRRTIGLQVSGNEAKSVTYPIKTKLQKLKFAQAKKPLNYLYSYFSIHILDCDEDCDITLGVSRKDNPNKWPPGMIRASIGYSSNGAIFLNGSQVLKGCSFTKGDVVGCGIIYPSNYKYYVDLSSDDSSDGMSDIVLTSLLNVNKNKKSVDFVRQVLSLNIADPYTDDECSKISEEEIVAKKSRFCIGDADGYNENYVESRVKVEVYFTCNMQVMGKVSTYIPIGGFYPTFHMFNTSAIKMSFDFNPPSS